LLIANTVCTIHVRYPLMHSRDESQIFVNGADCSDVDDDKVQDAQIAAINYDEYVATRVFCVTEARGGF